MRGEESKANGKNLRGGSGRSGAYRLSATGTLVSHGKSRSFCPSAYSVIKQEPQTRPDLRNSIKASRFGTGVFSNLER